MFYTNIHSCVINNGMASDYFTLEGGVRQGDPLSPYLFILAVKSLAISIRQHFDIKGIKIGNHESYCNTQTIPQQSCLMKILQKRYLKN